MLTITLLLLPVSYVMNRFVYHHWAMRGLLAGLTVLGLPIAVIAMFFLRPTHYFGLLPLWRTGSVAGAEGWWASLWRFIDLLKHPFLEQMEAPDDQAGWDAAVEGLLVTPGAAKGQKTVPEELWSAARALALIQGQGAWQAEHDRLTVASLTPPGPVEGMASP